MRVNLHAREWICCRVLMLALKFTLKLRAQYSLHKFRWISTLYDGLISPSLPPYALLTGFHLICTVSNNIIYHTRTVESRSHKSLVV